ncbi:uncharacterized protein B0H18DRAFT_980495 [Fomitopsis serialis]|uniref:uncharacterized protein n=1 Tax=Fomitopsis serialis TaxID=139415 RepID=UPI00200741C1|nr:uncharacterized protein B0H18DRAFT_980495 [Neoantrodia serialis]KAH9934280.1 hypothetical protein B0H18DRAFT_980495 [Neoantrodia serialis]
MSHIPLVSTNLATVALESVFYGIFLVLATTSIFFHISRFASARQSPRRDCGTLLGPVFVGSILVSLTVTGHWIITVIRLFDAFVNYSGGNAPLAYYSFVWLSTDIALNSFLVATLIVCDSMLCYRLWVVWNHNYVVIILPICAIIGLCVAGPVAIYQQTLVRGSIFAATLTHWVNACYAFTFATNIYSSCGIAYRVWLARQRIHSFGGPNLTDVLVTMVESAALYASYSIFFLGTYEAKSNLQFFTIGTLCPVAGIAFMLINVRVGLGWAQRGTPHHSSSGLSSARSGITHGSSNTGASFAMRPLTVDVTTVVHQDGNDLEQSRMKTDYDASGL